ncbi:MAG: VOC family protein [Gemmatimonadetes bacterium]|nr:VOC family protein [Gemmatimonadota bacterium]
MTSAALNAATMFPSLTVNDITKSLHFYVDGLGFEIVDKNEVDGVLRFAMLKAGNVMLGVGQDDFAKGRDRVKGVGARFWIQTAQDLVALADRAKAAGVKLDADPAPLPWGPMAFALVDPDGFLITISSAS